jgi:hypothetical protein
MFGTRHSRPARNHLQSHYTSLKQIDSNELAQLISIISKKISLFFRNELLVFKAFASYGLRHIFQKSFVRDRPPRIRNGVWRLGPAKIVRQCSLWKRIYSEGKVNLFSEQSQLQADGQSFCQPKMAFWHSELSSANLAALAGSPIADLAAFQRGPV